LARTIAQRADRARVPSLQAKLGIVAEEADETVYWLELLRDAKLIPEGTLSKLLKEANELTAIFTAGGRSSSRNQTSNLKPQTSFS
jgi:four helix bundle protein